MNHFIIYFDIAAILVLITVFSLYKQQHLVKNIVHRTYTFFWLFAFFTPISDIAAVLFMDYRYKTFFHIANSFYYLCIQWSAFFFYLFTLAPLARRNTMTLPKKLLLSVPIISISAVIVSNPFTRFLSYYDFSNDIYVLKSGIIFCYLVVGFYYIRALWFVIHRKDVYNPHIRYSILNTIVLIGASVTVQAIFPKYLVHSFFISLALLQMLVVSLHQGITKNPETGMLNKNAFYDRVNNLIYNKVPFTAITVRIADFEVLMSTYGLDNIASMEQLMCQEIQTMIPKDSGYKLYDDLYSFVFEEQSKENRWHMLKEIDELLSRKWTTNGVDISFSHFVVGFSYPDHYKSVDELVSLIIFLNKTRRMRYGIMPIEEFAIRDLHREQDIEHVMVDALKNRDFEIYYQPIYNTKTKKFTTAEALIRLYKSPLGPIGPSEFIPIAEKTGQIIQIGEYVLEEVCRFISEHDMDAMGLEYIEVNLSTIQCLQRNFFANLLNTIEKYEVSPSRICFEITETASNCSPEIFSQNLKLLHDEGFKLAIDDFGTGYGNLQRLISMDFDIVKFDNTTTHQICVDDKIRPIFSKMVVMIHSMNALVVAEGVEQAEEVDFLSSIDTDYLQGYYYSIPLDQNEFAELLSK